MRIFMKHNTIGGGGGTSILKNKMIRAYEHVLVMAINNSQVNDHPISTSKSQESFGINRLVFRGGGSVIYLMILSPNVMEQISCSESCENK